VRQMHTCFPLCRKANRRSGNQPPCQHHHTSTNDIDYVHNHHLEKYQNTNFLYERSLDYSAAQSAWTPSESPVVLISAITLEKLREANIGQVDIWRRATSLGIRSLNPPWYACTTWTIAFYSQLPPTLVLSRPHYFQ
jgi:hypothetical protein